MVETKVGDGYKGLGGRPALYCGQRGRGTRLIKIVTLVNWGRRGPSRPVFRCKKSRVGDLVQGWVVQTPWCAGSRCTARGQPNARGSSARSNY